MQLYLVTVEVDLGDAIEETKCCVSATNAESAADAACINCQIAPSMAQVTTKRIKGNVYGFAQQTRHKQMPTVAMSTICGNEGASVRSGEVAKIEALVRQVDYRPELIKRRLELRATIFSRTDGAACVGVSKGLDSYGRTGKWDIDFVNLEDLKIVQAEELRPSNPRVLQNAQYAVTKIFRS